MQIKQFRIQNYKSFLDTGYADFESGFNVIVGKNNVGKTALVELLYDTTLINPHHTKRTHSNPRFKFMGEPFPKMELSLEVTKQELFELLVDLGQFEVPFNRMLGIQPQLEHFRNSIAEHNIFKFEIIQSQVRNAFLEALGNGWSDLDPLKSYRYKIDPLTNIIDFVDYNSGNTPMGSGGGANNFANQLVNLLLPRIFLFKAIRNLKSEYKYSASRELLTDASNLPQVLHVMQSNVNLFKRYNDAINKIFPQIKQVTAPLSDKNRASIYVWDIDSDDEREDLAIPLADSGTGIGQVLSILYVVLTSSIPQTIIIDEPQSFLHPGAIRKLFEILKEYPQNQYIVTTHSPEVISSASPSTLLLVTKERGESNLQLLKINETNQLRNFLLEIGARLSDVFGADSVLWVEGPTEEKCFPLILTKLLPISKRGAFLGTKILGVVSTGDFEGRKAEAIFDIYERLSKGPSLLPPTIGLVFDKEGRTQREEEDLIRKSKGKIKIEFLPRRMFENYLLNPNAIAYLISSLGNSTSSEVLLENITQWLEDARNQLKFIENLPIEKSNVNSKNWLQYVHGDKLLKGLFSNFLISNQYDKIKHGEALTNWIIDNSPQDFDEIINLLIKMTS